MIKIEGANELTTTNTGTLSKQDVPISVGKLELALLARYPRADAESWDRTGLLAGDPAALVSGVAVALDATCEAVKAARRAGANVLLTHHPAFIEPPASFMPAHGTSSAAGSVVYTAIAEGVALMNVHTALDASKQATRLFPGMLSLDFGKLLAPLAHDPEKGYAALCSVRNQDRPFKLRHLAARATSVFGCAPRVWGDFESLVEHVVIANGSANEFVDAAIGAKADCLVCGEVRYHTALAAAERGLSVIELGHDVSEFPLCALLAQAAVDAGVPQDQVMVIDQSSKWRYPDAVRV